MTMPELALALMMLLLTPGPTNTLVLLSGAERGFLKTLPLIPAELAAYLAVVLPLALAAEALSESLGILRPALAAVAGIWVLYLAWTMWRFTPERGQPQTVTARRLAVTTLLNPKGLVMGLVLLPAAGVGVASVTLMTGCIAAVAALWAFFGCCLPGPDEGADLPPRLLRRAAAVWLAGLSVFIVAGGFTA